jgi:hypothetical protein
MRRLAATALVALAIPAMALAAQEGRYKGKVVGDSGKVSFKVAGNKVKNFKIDGVYANCYGGGMLMSVYVPSARIRNNRFKRTYQPDPDSEFHVILRGRFSGGRATGTVKGEGLCGYEEKWTARKR